MWCWEALLLAQNRTGSSVLHQTGDSFCRVQTICQSYLSVISVFSSLWQKCDRTIFRVETFIWLQWCGSHGVWSTSILGDTAYRTVSCLWVSQEELSPQAGTTSGIDFWSYPPETSFQMGTVAKFPQPPNSTTNWGVKCKCMNLVGIFHIQMMPSVYAIVFLWIHPLMTLKDSHVLDSINSIIANSEWSKSVSWDPFPLVSIQMFLVMVLPSGTSFSDISVWLRQSTHKATVQTCNNQSHFAARWYFTPTR